MDGWMDGRTDGRTDGWMDGWIDGGMDGCAVDLYMEYVAEASIPQSH